LKFIVLKKVLKNVKFIKSILNDLKKKKKKKNGSSAALYERHTTKKPEEIRPATVKLQVVPEFPH